MKRVFLIVLDSCGAGALPDAATFGDEGTHTLRSCYKTGELHVPNLLRMGLGNIENLEFLGGEEKPIAAYGYDNRALGACRAYFSKAFSHISKWISERSPGAFFPGNRERCSVQSSLLGYRGHSRLRR